jgi:hypothetical protein
LIKDVPNWVDKKNVKELNEIKLKFIVYQRTKVQKMGNLKNERVKKI